MELRPGKGGNKEAYGYVSLDSELPLVMAFSGLSPLLPT